MSITERIKGGTRTRDSHVWRNPTESPMQISIFEGPPPPGRESDPTDDGDEWKSNTDRKPSRANFFERSVEPGASVELPAEYTYAIHDIRDGVIVGGIAPLLVRVDPPQTAKLHSSLIPKRNEISHALVNADQVGAIVKASLAADDDDLLVRARARRGATK